MSSPPPPAPSGAIPSSSTNHWTSSTRKRSSRATSSASAFTPATRGGATKSGRMRAPAGPGSCSAAFTPLYFQTRHASRAQRTRSSRGTATSSGPRSSRIVSQGIRCRCTRAVASLATRSCRRAGICCRGAGTCGPRCKRSAAVRNIVRFVPSGGPTARSRVNAASIAWCRRSWSSGAWASASSLSPTTISIP